MDTTGSTSLLEVGEPSARATDGAWSPIGIGAEQQTTPQGPPATVEQGMRVSPQEFLPKEQHVPQQKAKANDFQLVELPIADFSAIETPAERPKRHRIRPL